MIMMMIIILNSKNIDYYNYDCNNYDSTEAH